MASSNIIGMMVSKGAPYSVEQLRKMDDKECWKWIYKNHPPKSKRKHDKRLEICFTGFAMDERIKLERLAEKFGYKIVKSVTVNLNLLVTGETPGLVKIKKAQQVGAKIISENDYYGLLESIGNNSLHKSPSSAGGR